MTAEAQVKNDDAKPKTFSYEVSIQDREGKLVQTIDGGQQTIGAGETKFVSASANLTNLHFWSWGYGYLYAVCTTLKVNGQPVDTVNTRTGFRKTEFGHGYVKINDCALHYVGRTQEWFAQHRPEVGIGKTEGAYWALQAAGWRCPGDYRFMTLRRNSRGRNGILEGFDWQLELLAVFAGVALAYAGKQGIFAPENSNRIPPPIPLPVVLVV
ncbi:MAG: hypothetical protein WCO68_05745 [Verrucomicrobiota bacterium]